MSTKKAYHIFISYSHKDAASVGEIHRTIETLGLPFYKRWRHDVSIFRDVRKMPLAGSLSDKITEGLTNSEKLVVIASRNSAQSTWVKAEIEQWHQQNQDAEGYITNFNFILLDDVVAWDEKNRDFDKLNTTALPDFERRLFRELPLWANLQEYNQNGKLLTKNPNYEWEVAKIKAWILGRKPDEIINEVAQGKRIFRGFAIALIAILIGLTAFAFYQQQQARSKQIEADRNRAEADRKAAEAIANLRAFKGEEYQRNLASGNTYLAAEEFHFADSCFSQAIQTARDPDFKGLVPRKEIKYLDSVINLCHLKLSQP